MSEFFSAIKNELLVLILAAAPISELRGAIPLGISLGFSPIHSAILSVIGNSIPVPFLLLFLRPVFDFFGETKAFGGIISWIKRRTLKRSKNIEKYSALGLFLFVAIPFPTTGAWTGAIAAVLFNIKFRYAFPAIIAGIITAGLIVLALSYQALSFF